MINVTYVQAVKDVNGNPRRGWIIETPDGYSFVDEGYRGMGALYHWLSSDETEAGWKLGSEIYISHVANRRDRNILVRQYKIFKDNPEISYLQMAAIGMEF